jgi:ABC-type polar amino acid transport system ATPase subunit
MTLIIAKDLTLTYKNSQSPALDHVSFSIEEGRITQFLGKSGSGKTTLLKCISNLHANFSGSLSLNGQPIKSMDPKERAQAIGFVAQSFDLFPHMTVGQNCIHPQVHVLKRKPKDALENTHSHLSRLNIEKFFDRYPKELSGGQKQRVSIARALCMDSKLLLLDEPTSALDPDSSKSLVGILLKLQKSGVTLALSTHDMSFSTKLFDRVYFMQNGSICEYFDAKIHSLENTQILKSFFTE